MSQRKTILHSVVSLVIGIVVGSCATGWYAWRQKSREIQESIIQTKYVQTITLIRLCETLENGETESARYGLEESLNANISYMATNAYQHSKSGSMARETIKMAANHRTKYPFRANNPCINKMVCNRLPSHQLGWTLRTNPPSVLERVIWQSSPKEITCIRPSHLTHCSTRTP